MKNPTNDQTRTQIYSANGLGTRERTQIRPQAVSKVIRTHTMLQRSFERSHDPAAIPQPISQKPAAGDL